MRDQEFRLLQAQNPDYTYREPRLTDESDKTGPSDWEADIIQDFRSNPVERASW